MYYNVIYYLVCGMLSQSVICTPSCHSGLMKTFVPTRGVDPYRTGGHVPPIFMKFNILEVMLFRMSARVIATVVCCILMQILCVVSQKSFSFWGTTKSPRPPTGFSAPDPAGGFPSPRPPVFLYVPPIILWDRRRWYPLICMGHVYYLEHCDNNQWVSDSHWQRIFTD